MISRARPPRPERCIDVQALRSGFAVTGRRCTAAELYR